MKWRIKYLLLSALIPSIALGQNQPPPAPVTVDLAQRDLFSATLWVSGTVISRNDSRIAAETDGRITWIAEPGTVIEEGQAIARIDHTDLDLDLMDSEAQLGSLNAQLRYQENNVTRLKQLASNNNAAANQLDEAQSQLDMTRQDIKRAEVSIAQIKRRIDQSNVLAPFPGLVVERLIQVGEFVNRGNQIARLVDTEHREIRAQAPLSVAAYLQQGQEVSVDHDTLISTSPIERIIPVGDERSRMFEVRLAADNPALVVGSPVKVALPNSEPRDLVAIPRDALVLRGNQIYVLRVNEESTAERVDIRTGIGLGNMVEVIGDVYEGDQVIIRGAERIQPGQAVIASEVEDNPRGDIILTAQ